MNALNEEVLVVSRSSLPDTWCQPKVCIPGNRSIVKIINGLPFSFIPRNLAEGDSSFKQLIPYIIVEWKGKIAVYQRAGSEKRLTGLWSIGVGGHVNSSDGNDSTILTSIVLSGAQREIDEEFNVRQYHHPGFRFLGLINEEITDVGKVHLGLVLVCSLQLEALPGSELKNMEWVWPDDVSKYDVELWSGLAYFLYSKYVTKK